MMPRHMYIRILDLYDRHSKSTLSTLCLEPITVNSCHDLINPLCLLQLRPGAPTTPSSTEYLSLLRNFSSLNPATSLAQLCRWVGKGDAAGFL